MGELPNKLDEAHDAGTTCEFPTKLNDTNTDDIAGELPTELDDKDPMIPRMNSQPSSDETAGELLTKLDTIDPNDTGGEVPSNPAGVDPSATIGSLRTCSLA